MSDKRRPRLVIVQYADFRHAVLALSTGKSQTYYGQSYSLDAIASLVPQAEEVVVIATLTQERYDEVLPNGVRVIGLMHNDGGKMDELLQTIAELRPTILVNIVTGRKIFQWAIDNEVTAVALFIGSFVGVTLRQRLARFLWARLLNHSRIAMVCSYGMTAARAIEQAGVKPAKIVPWDYLVDPDDPEVGPRTLRPGNTHKVVYVSQPDRRKGIGEVIRAVARLRSAGRDLRLQVVGFDKGCDSDKLAQELDIQDAVEFLGYVANSSIEPMMRAADLVVVPSWHEFPEGFPIVIHHALRQRTPIVASDHPMFVRHLRSRQNAMIFPARNAAGLAAAIAEVLGDADLYARISAASQVTWQETVVPVKYGDVFRNCLRDTAQRQAWIAANCLAAMPKSSIDPPA